MVFFQEFDIGLQSLDFLANAMPNLIDVILRNLPFIGKNLPFSIR